MPKFRVTGYAYVPVLCAIDVEAVSTRDAFAVASKRWQDAPSRDRFILPRSQDEASVHSFEPSDATEMPPPPPPPAPGRDDVREHRPMSG